mmetsp:Transcript_14311/g.47377  ORF Transcript_14311/g.47377 Transcript_14311/m.47377 type:complete len:214 (+) Transcript_14311:2150-2791(+)
MQQRELHVRPDEREAKEDHGARLAVLLGHVGRRDGLGGLPGQRLNRLHLPELPDRVHVGHLHRLLGHLELLALEDHAHRHLVRLQLAVDLRVVGRVLAELAVRKGLQLDRVLTRRVEGEPHVEDRLEQPGVRVPVVRVGRRLVPTLDHVGASQLRESEDEVVDHDRRRDEHAHRYRVGAAERVLSSVEGFAVRFGDCRDASGAAEGPRSLLGL